MRQKLAGISKLDPHLLRFELLQEKCSEHHYCSSPPLYLGHSGTRDGVYRSKGLSGTDGGEKVKNDDKAGLTVTVR